MKSMIMKRKKMKIKIWLVSSFPHLHLCYILSCVSAFKIILGVQNCPLSLPEIRAHTFNIVLQIHKKYIKRVICFKLSWESKNVKHENVFKLLINITI